MRRPAPRLVSCALAGAATVLVGLAAAGPDPVDEPGGQQPTVSAAPTKAPLLTRPSGRKLV